MREREGTSELMPRRLYGRKGQMSGERESQLLSLVAHCARAPLLPHEPRRREINFAFENDEASPRARGESAALCI